MRIDLDDFGSSHSALAHLQWLNVDVLKIDRMFVEQAGRSARAREIAAAVTAMCQALGITVVGEGIETSCQLKSLTALHCEKGQGFLFARPLPPEAIATLAVPGTGAGPAVDHGSRGSAVSQCHGPPADDEDAGDRASPHEPVSAGGECLFDLRAVEEDAPGLGHAASRSAAER